MIDLIRYPVDVIGSTLAMWCTDCCGNPSDDPIWTMDEAAEQVTEFCLANLVAIAEEHEAKHHQDEPEPAPTHSNALTPKQQAALGRPCICYPTCAAEG